MANNIEVTDHSQIIHLNDWQWRYRPRTRGGETTERRERVYLTECTCGRGRYLSLHDARRVNQCSHCRNVAAGNAYIAKYGRDGLAEKVQQWLNSNPNKPESKFAKLLRELGIQHDTNVILRTENGHCYLMDFYIVIGTETLVIELNGHYWHNKPDQQARDKAKYAEIARRGWRLAVLDSAEVMDYETCDVLAILP